MFGNKGFVTKVCMSFCENCFSFCIVFSHKQDQSLDIYIYIYKNFNGQCEGF